MPSITQIVKSNVTAAKPLSMLNFNVTIFFGQITKIYWSIPPKNQLSMILEPKTLQKISKISKFFGQNIPRKISQLLRRKEIPLHLPPKKTEFN